METEQVEIQGVSGQPLLDAWMQSSSGVAVVSGAEHRLERANAAFLCWAGLEEEEWTGRSLRQVIAARSAPGAPGVLDNALHKGRALTTAEHVQMSLYNGRMEKTISCLECLPLRLGSGESGGLLLLLRERMVPGSVSECEQYFRHMILHSPVPMCLLGGEQFIVQMANPAMTGSLWKRQPEEVLGRPLLEVFPELEGQPFPALLRRVYHTGEPFREQEAVAYVHTEAGMVRYYLDFEYSPVQSPDGGIQGIMVTATDVTEKVMTRQKVEDAEARLRLAAEGTGLATWDLDLQTFAIIASPRFYEILGVAPTQHMTLGRLRELLDPDDRRTLVEPAFQKAMETGIYIYEARITTPAGEQRWIQKAGKVFFDAEGLPARMLGTLVDITQSKQAQQALKESEQRYRKLAEELECRVAERTRDLSEANKSLERSNKELEQFAFVTSHDLQEPLRKIQMFANLLSFRDSSRLSESALLYVDKISTAARRMSRLISDLLNFSRLSGREDRFRATNLHELIPHILSDLELLIRQKGARIECGQLPQVWAIPLQMNQLFYNLLGNALKFANADRAPLIRIEAREPEAHPALNPRLSYCEIIVSDNGIGFDQKYAAKIFEIFQRLNDRDAYEGTGIGLALCSKIVANHEGLIFARSSEGEGSSFHLLLPTGPASAEA